MMTGDVNKMENNKKNKALNEALNKNKWAQLFPIDGLILTMFALGEFFRTEIHSYVFWHIEIDDEQKFR